VTAIQAEHDLKSWTQFFVPILSGERVHELRRNDRNFQVGDFLNLHEWDSVRSVPTGRIASAQITSITSDDFPCAVSDIGLVPGFCILSIRLVEK
jgi:hypothetical protein